MSADKTTAKIGKILDGSEERDAIHVAVLPVVAAEDLICGEIVGLTTEGTAYESAPGIGIVDPYLRRGVKKGERFYLFLYPGSITSLRHDWTHPAVVSVSVQTPEDDAEKAQSKEWLEAFADRLFSYYGKRFEEYPDEEPETEYGTRLDLLLSQAEDGHFPTDIEYGDNVTPDAEFWTHYERYTGRKVEDKPTRFSCSC